MKSTTDVKPDFFTFVNKRIIEHIVHADREDLCRACRLYGIELDEFKKEHSEEITFELLKK